jgi:hypothetical protein
VLTTPAAGDRWVDITARDRATGDHALPRGRHEMVRDVSHQRASPIRVRRPATRPVLRESVTLPQALLPARASARRPLAPQPLAKASRTVQCARVGVFGCSVASQYCATASKRTRAPPPVR